MACLHWRLRAVTRLVVRAVAVRPGRRRIAFAVSVGSAGKCA